MADSSNSTLLPKLHPGLSRRALMREMAAAGMLAAVPVAAVAAPVPKTTPQERLTALIEEIQAVAREIDPEIEEWKVHINLDSKLHGCPLLIAAFHAHPNFRAEPHVSVGWTFENRAKS